MHILEGDHRQQPFLWASFRACRAPEILLLVTSACRRSIRLILPSSLARRRGFSPQTLLSSFYPETQRAPTSRVLLSIRQYQWILPRWIQMCHYSWCLIVLQVITSRIDLTQPDHGFRRIRRAQYVGEMVSLSAKSSKFPKLYGWAHFIHGNRYMPHAPRQLFALFGYTGRI